MHTGCVYVCVFFAGALNGLAALLWLVQQQPEAVAAYREVLGLSEASKGVVRLDSFQLLHTLHNLAELLAELQRKQQQRQQQRGCSAAAAAAATGASATAAAAAAEPGEPYGPGVPRTLRDDSLASEAAAIREQYLAQRQAELATAHQAFLKAAKDALPAGLRKSKRQQQSAGAAGSSGAGGGAQEGILDELLAAGDDLMGTVGDGGGARAGGEDVADGEGTAAGASVGEGWYIAVIDALKEAGADEEVAEVIRVKLQESDTYIRQVGLVVVDCCGAVWGAAGTAWRSVWCVVVAFAVPCDMWHTAVRISIGLFLCTDWVGMQALHTRALYVGPHSHAVC